MFRFCHHHQFSSNTREVTSLWASDFSGSRSGGLVFPSLEEFSTVCCDPHKGFGIVNKVEVNVFLELSYFFYDPVDIGSLVSTSSAFSKSNLNVWKFRAYVLSKITADGDCSHEIKRRLLLGRKVMTNLDSIFKSRDITLPTKVRLVKAMAFPVVMRGCES